MGVLNGPISEININAGSRRMWRHQNQDVGHDPQSIWPWTLTQNDGQHSWTAPLPHPATNNWVFHCQNVGKELRGASSGRAGGSCRRIWQRHQLSKTTTAKVDIQRFRGQRSIANRLQRCTSRAEKIEYRGGIPHSRPGNQARGSCRAEGCCIHLHTWEDYLCLWVLSTVEAEGHGGEAQLVLNVTGNLPSVDCLLFFSSVLRRMSLLSHK